MKFRWEEDLLGRMKIPADALWGIHTARATENFKLSGRKVHPFLIRAFGAVKWACAQTNFELGCLQEAHYRALEDACREMLNGELDDFILTDALQGGAGTSLNMNVNEVLCNRALQLLGKSPGSYEVLHPIEQVNLHQSTNDTFPTALRVAALWLLDELEDNLVALLETLQTLEHTFADVVRIARTELQDAVLTTMGGTFGAFAEPIARDRWRVYKSKERLRVVNLGGTAIGTGITAPRRYIFRVVENLKNITRLALARAENLIDATQNADPIVEADGILQTCAVNLFKISNDLRWLASGPESGLREIVLPPRQAGSSIMPGKVNPVIPEAVIQAALTVMSNHERLSKAAALGNFELNAFLPLMADALLTNLDLLKNAVRLLDRCCLRGIRVNREVCRQNVLNSTATLTALVSRIGYARAQALAGAMQESGKSLKTLVLGQNLLSESEFEQLISAESVTRLGEKESAHD